jgi:hypothetical protein
MKRDWRLGSKIKIRKKVSSAVTENRAKIKCRPDRGRTVQAESAAGSDEPVQNGLGFESRMACLNQQQGLPWGRPARLGEEFWFVNAQVG